MDNAQCKGNFWARRGYVIYESHVLAMHLGVVRGEYFCNIPLGDY